MIKEVTVLPDMQRSEDSRGIGLWKVGVKEVEIPLQISQRDGGTQMVHAVTSMGVSCSKFKKGVNMSRFVVHLVEWSAKGPFSSDLRHFLQDMRERLEAEDAHCDLTFRYFIQKAAPVTGLTAPMAISVSFRGSVEKTPDGDVYCLRVGIEIPIANCCPCSKAISEYGAHNQRSYIRAECVVDTASGAPKVWIEDLVDHLEEAASCPVYPLLKRPDEKYVTERQYDNPKFVEDVIRDATLQLRKIKGLKGFTLEVEALESIHGHNAWAAHRETPGDPVME